MTKGRSAGGAAAGSAEALAEALGRIDPRKAEALHMARGGADYSGWLGEALIALANDAGLASDDDDLTVLAAEAALGLLSPSEVSALAAVCEIDPEIGRVRQGWADAVAGLSQAPEPAAEQAEAQAQAQAPAPGPARPRRVTSQPAPLAAPLAAPQPSEPAPRAEGSEISERVTPVDMSEPNRRPWMGTFAAILAGLVAAAILLYLFDLSLNG
jgi:hypothetical protein